MVRLLCEAGADKGKADQDGTTPLAIALYFADKHPNGREGVRELVELLLAHDADPAVRTEARCSALEIAREQELDAVVLLLDER